MNKKYLFICVILFSAFSFSHTKAQVFTGGNASVNFLNNNIYADIAPIVGYQLSRLRAGISPVFAYSKYQNQSENYSYGGRVFAQLTLIAGLFLHAEFEALNVETAVSLLDATTKDRTWVLGAPVGAGYNQSLGEKINLQVTVLYNVIQDVNYPYQNPIIRGGIVYSF